MSSTPILLVHAFPLDSRMWSRQLAALAGSRAVLAPDLRGFGQRASEPGPTSIDQHARDLVDLLDRSRIVRAAIVGVSMGGYIALALHRIAPDRIAGLMLCDTKAEPDSDQAKSARTARIERIRRDGLGFLPDEMMPVLVAPSASEEVKLELRRIMLEQRPQGVEAALMAMRDRGDSTSVLSSIRVPTSLVCGEHDALTPPKMMQQMASSIPGAAFSVIEGAGHLPNLEAPQAFGRAVSALLERVPAP